MGVCHTPWTWGEVRSLLTLLNGSKLRRGQGAPKKTPRTRSIGSPLPSVGEVKACFPHLGETRNAWREDHSSSLLASKTKGRPFLFDFVHPGLYLIKFEHTPPYIYCFLPYLSTRNLPAGGACKDEPAQGSLAGALRLIVLRAKKGNIKKLMVL